MLNCNAIMIGIHTVNGSKSRTNQSAIASYHILFNLKQKILVNLCHTSTKGSRCNRNKIMTLLLRFKQYLYEQKSRELGWLSIFINKEYNKIRAKEF